MFGDKGQSDVSIVPLESDLDIPPIRHASGLHPRSETMSLVFLFLLANFQHGFPSWRVLHLKMVWVALSKHLSNQGRCESNSWDSVVFELT